MNFAGGGVRTQLTSPPRSVHEASACMISISLDEVIAVRAFITMHDKMWRRPGHNKVNVHSDWDQVRSRLLEGQTEVHGPTNLQ